MRNKNKVIRFARKYLRRGWHIVPIPRRSKAPVLTGWLKLNITDPELCDYFFKGSNIGILLGDASGGLVDTDLDCPEAIALAPRILPHTDRLHGRDSKKTSHYWYDSHPVALPEKFLDTDGTCLVEIRSNGQQTVVPPSVHPSGERIVWERGGRPSRVDERDLRAAVARLAAASLIARHYPLKGSRNEFALALSGLLLRAGWMEDDTADFVEMIAVAAGDEESKLRRVTAKATRRRLGKNSTATGRPTLEALLGKRVVARVCNWLAVSSEARLKPSHRDDRRQWPESLHKKAFYGLAGDIVNAISPHTEADVPALIIQFLVLFGNIIGRKPHCMVGEQPHNTNLFAIVVGRTSRARKGTSFAEVKHFFDMGPNDNWCTARIQRGLSSGEGLIWAVRDPEERLESAAKGNHRVSQSKKYDPGVKDKRLLVIETEFAAILRVAKREGNTLSAVVRSAWDQSELSILTKNSPVRATGAHISIVGHITRDELRRELRITESDNGFANRFLWTCAKRGPLLPFGGRIPGGKKQILKARLRKTIEFAQRYKKIRFSELASKLWERKYPALTVERLGMFGKVTSRSEAQVLRLSLIYALLDKSSVIKTQHLRAALAVWRYCEDSARYIFGDAIGDAVADQILRQLRKEPRGLTRTEIREIFSHNRSEGEIAEALTVLEELGIARCDRERTQGRPTQRWRLVGRTP